MAWNTPGKGSGSPKNTGNPVEDLMNRIKDGFNGRGGSQGTGPLPIIIGLLVVLRISGRMARLPHGVFASMTTTKFLNSTQLVFAG